MKGNEYKECPFCREKIKVIASKCRHCHSLLYEEADSKVAEKIPEEPFMPDIPVKKPIWKRRLLWLTAILVLLIVMASGRAGENEPLIEADDVEESGEAEAAEPAVSVDNKTAELEAVIKKYEPRFEKIEEEIRKDVETLFANALQEYEQQSGNFLNQILLVNKYMKEIQLIEEKADASFYSMLNQMNNELNSKGLPTTVIDEMEENYEQDKKQKKQELSDFLRSQVSL